MTQALTKTEKEQSVKHLLHQHSKSLVAALPKQIGVERFSRIVMTSVQLTPGLLECTPQSLLSAVLTCAQLGLEPDGVRNMAHLVPFGKKVTFIPGYMGLLDLAMRSGKFRNIEAHIVYAQDAFDYAHGSNPFITHKPAYEKADRGEQIAAYCIAFFKEAGFQFRVMPMSDIHKIRDRSPAGKSGPWVTDFDAMALKTAIRHSVKYLPSSVVDQSLSLAVSLDERAEAGLDQQLEILTGVETVDTTTGEITEEPGKSALDELAEKHGAPPPEGMSEAIREADVAFMDSFKNLRKSGIEKFWIEHHQKILDYPVDHPVRVEFYTKYKRLLEKEPSIPSFASPAPSGPTTMPDAPEQPPEEPPDMPPAPPEETEPPPDVEGEGQPPLFGEGKEPEEATSEDLDANLASLERTLEIDKFVKDAGIQLKEWHDWAITTSRMFQGRYTGYFSHCFASDPDTEFSAFGAYQL